jgi:hypothetical protein
MKRLLIAAGMTAMLALPAPASARTDCSYANGSVYAETTSASSGTSGAADVAAGVCVDNVAPAQGLYGGLVEAGVGMDNGQVAGRQDVLGARVPGVYAIYDGDDQNWFVADYLGGYAGVSNFESGHRDLDCDGVDEGTGTNSGDCLTLRGIISIPGSPLACGNTTGKSWHEAARDGCTQPDLDCCGGRAASARDGRSRKARE